MKSSSSRASVIGLVLLLLVAGCGTKETRTPRQLMDAGVAAWAGGRTVEAEDLLKRSVERAAKSGMDKHSLRLHHFGLFEFYAAQNRYEEAERAYAGVETTTDFMVNRVSGHNLGVLRMRAGKNAEAIEIFAAIRHSLDISSRSGDERPVEIMVLMHLDLASIAAGEADTGHGADTLTLLDDMVRFQMGNYPRLHPALLRELGEYSASLREAGRDADAQAIHDRLTTQLARGAAPGLADDTCLSIVWDPPLGCILALAP